MTTVTITTVPVGVLGTNCYLVASGAGSCAIIDPGAQPGKIADTITRMGWKPQMILLTHGHHDHIGAVGKLRAQFDDIPVYIGANDEEMLADGSKSMAMFRTDDDEEFLIAGAQIVTEGDSIPLDELDFVILDTPGHTRGGVVYVCGEALFAGDTLFRENVGRTDLYGGDYATLCKSLQKLAALPGDYTVYPGHGESTTLAYEKRSNPYMRGGL